MPSNTHRIRIPSRGNLCGVCPYMFTNCSFLGFSSLILDMCHVWGGCVCHQHIPNHSEQHPQSAHPERPSWTLPLPYGNRLRMFTTCISYQRSRHRHFCSLASQEHHPCLRRDLPCSIHTPANTASCIDHGTHLAKPPPKVPKTTVMWNTE